MLRTKGVWEDLSAEQRIVLFSVAFELRRVAGISVLYRDALINSGMTPEDFAVTVAELESYQLIQLDAAENLACESLTFIGIAVSNELVPKEKHKDLLEHDFLRLKQLHT